ncbi:hypothetical protein Tco_1164761 [Tanacetum coccineum]
MNERYSAVLLNELPLKEKDPRSFTTPCQVFEKHKKAEDLAADHLSRFENPHMKVLTKREIADKFLNDHLMLLKSKFNNDEPCYADFVNYIVGKELLEYMDVHNNDASESLKPSWGMCTLVTMSTSRGK